MILLVMVLVVLGAPARAALGAAGALTPLLACTVLWGPLETRGHSFLVAEEACGKEAGSGGGSFPCQGVAAAGQSPAMGLPGSWGSSVRTGWVSSLSWCSAWAACCLCALCLLMSCSSSWRKPVRARTGCRMEPGLSRKAPG